MDANGAGTNPLTVAGRVVLAGQKLLDDEKDKEEENEDRE